MRFWKLCLGFCLAGALSPALAADWPQYRGVNSDGVSPESTLASWPAEGPRVLWKINVQDAFGSFAIENGAVYFISKTNNDETCYAVDFKTGKALWSAKLDRTILQSNGGIGPRSTPVIVDGRVYTYGTYLKLHCLDAKTGSVVWKHDIATEFNGQLHTRGIDMYGSAASPVVEGNLVIVAGGGPGQSFLAFDKNNGGVVWKKGSELMTHATPTPAAIAGVRQLVFFTRSGLVSIEPKTGDELWRFAAACQGPVGASAVVSGDIVYCSAGYNLGAAACQVAQQNGRFVVKQLWRKPNQLMNQWSTPVIKDGYVYGLFGTQSPDNAPLECVELSTGREMWRGPSFGQGEVMIVGGKLIVQSSRGELALANPSPTAYKEISRAQILGGQSWGFPAFSNGVLFYRSNRQIAALELQSTN